MIRREFITLIVGAAAAWPLAGWAQERERMRRVGMVTGVLETDAAAQARFAVLRQALQQLGWTEGRNIQFYKRFGSAGDSDLVRRNAQELVALGTDLIVAAGSQNVAALQQVSRTVPIVFVGIVDPVGAGFVASIARPGGSTSRGFCEPVQRWTNRDADGTYNQASRPDQHTRGPAPFVRRLPCALLRHFRWSNLLRA
jgi:ABC-type uncharacterized transport system substrate-binding protein